MAIGYAIENMPILVVTLGFFYICSSLQSSVGHHMGQSSHVLII
jgi:hypothetical protein